MNSSSETGSVVPSDEALLRRVQQQNQRQIVSQLLHDLRNPVHSMRITMELFARLARRTGDLDKLMDRAASYIAPAEAALNALLTANERMGTYLANPAPPVMAPLAVNDWLTEIGFLLRHSKLRLRVTCSPVDQSWQLTADRPRLSHALLQYCLGGGASQVTLAARSDPAEHIHIDVSFDPQEAGPHGAEPPGLTLEELRTLIENAGGALAPDTGPGLSVRFARSAP